METGWKTGVSELTSRAVDNIRLIPRSAPSTIGVTLGK